MRRLEAKFGEPIEVILRRLYYEEGLSQAEVAKKLRIPPGTLGGWMIRLGINQRALAGQAAKELAS
jgi:transcriptional regulator with XRE-family HTH domain